MYDIQKTELNTYITNQVLDFVLSLVKMFSLGKSSSTVYSALVQSATAKGFLFPQPQKFSLFSCSLRHWEIKVNEYNFEDKLNIDF